VQVQLASLRAALLNQAMGLQFKGAAATAAGRIPAGSIAGSVSFMHCRSPRGRPPESQAKLSAIAGTQAAQLEVFSGEAQQLQQLESQLVDWRGAAVAESRAAQEQLASLRAVLLSQAERLGLQVQVSAAAAARESSWLECWSGELLASQTATEQPSRDLVSANDLQATLENRMNSDCASLDRLAAENARARDIERWCHSRLASGNGGVPMSRQAGSER